MLTKIFLFLDCITKNLELRKGKIEFKDLSLKYTDIDSPVLKNLNFTFEHGEKVVFQFLG